MMDLVAYIQRHITWSKETFGPGARAEGLCKHIEKELAEIRKAPTDLMEWIDVIILAIDGAWRSGQSAEAIAMALGAKQLRNMTRRYPRPVDENTPSEHIREEQWQQCPFAGGKELKCKWANYAGEACDIPANRADECVLNSEEDKQACREAAERRNV